MLKIAKIHHHTHARLGDGDELESALLYMEHILDVPFKVAKPAQLEYLFFFETQLEYRIIDICVIIILCLIF